MKTNSVVVYVTAESRSQTFTTDSNMMTLSANNCREALARVIFSNPDAIVIDARDNMTVARQTFFGLSSIEYPPVVVISNARQGWNLPGKSPVVVISPYSTDSEIEQAVRDVLAEKAHIAS